MTTEAMDRSADEPTPGRTGRQILVDWANEQDEWVRAIVSEVIATGRELSGPALDTALGALLAEKGLSGEQAPRVPKLVDDGALGDAAEELLLVGLSDVRGVNALAENQSIAFNPRLTVFFGENATGKTGYVRVLKRVAAVRSAEAVLSNIHTPSIAKSPHAKISYSLAGKAHQLNWNDETGVPPLTRVSIFDSRAVALHVDDDLTYQYTPRDLALFRYAAEAIEATKSSLDAARRERLPQGNPFLARFQRGTPPYPAIETLGVGTDLQALATLATVSPEEEAHLPTLRERAAAFQTTAIGSRLEISRADVELYATLLSFAQLVERFDFEAYNAAVARVQDAEGRRQAQASSMFSELQIPDELIQDWRTFVQAGHEFQNAAGRTEYPQHGDRCLYCNQQLDAAAVDLLGRYREYLLDRSAQDVREATAARDRVAGELLSASVTGLKTRVDAKVASLPNPTDVPSAVAASVSLIAAVMQTVPAIRAGQVAEAPTLASVAVAAVEATKTAHANATQAVADLTAQSSERATALQQVQDQISAIEARLVLRTLMPDITAYVERAKWAAACSTLLERRFPPIARSLTDASKQASEVLMNEDFDRLFQAECAALRAPTVKVEFPGRRGQPARRKSLVRDRRLSEVLSEGEQKVIALADFLAEASLGLSHAPVVFDDPVNSLDYRRLQYVVDRIYELSQHQQIIVFSHNIWFTNELVSRFEKHKGDCSFYEVHDADSQKGIISSGVNPRWDTPAKLKGRVNVLIQDAKAAAGESRIALTERAYDLMRSWCEVVVEQEILAGIAQRYQPNVMMTRVSKLRPDKMQTALDVIYPMFEKACREMGGHSQPLETLNTRATVEDLEADWKVLQDALTAYLAD